MQLAIAQRIYSQQNSSLSLLPDISTALVMFA